MVIIGVDHSLSNSALYKHVSLEKSKNIKPSGKCDYQQQCKAIIEDAMVSTIDGFTNNSPMSSVPYMPVNNIMQGNQSKTFLKHWTPN